MKLRSASALFLASALGAAALPPPDCTLRVSSFDELAALGSGLALTTELCPASDVLSAVEMAKEKAGEFGEFRPGDPIFVFVWGLSEANFKEADIPDVSVIVGLPVTKPADATPEFFKEGYSCIGTGDKTCYVDEDDLSVQLDDYDVDGFAYRGSYGFFLSTTNLLEADFASLISTPASFAGLPVEFTLRDFGKLMPSSEEMEEELTEAIENCSELAGDANGAFLKSLLKLQLKAAGLAKGLESMRCGMGFDPAKGLVFAEEMKLVPGSEAASFYGTDQVLDPVKLGPAPKNAFFHYATVGATEAQKKWIMDFFREIRPLVEAKISDEALRARVGKLYADFEALVTSIGGGEGFLGKDSVGRLAVSSSAKVADVAAYRAWLGEAVSLVRDLLELPADSTRLRLTDGGFACELEPAAQVSALSTNVPPAVGDVLTVLFGKKWSYEEKIAADGSIHGQGSSTGASLPKDDAFDYARLANEFGKVFPGVPVTMMAGGSYMAAIRDMVTPVFAALQATDPSVPSLDLELPAETGFSFAGSTAQGAVREVMFVSPGEIKGFAALLALGIRTQQQKCMEAIMDFAEDAEDWDPLEDDEDESEEAEDESEEAVEE